MSGVRVRERAGTLPKIVDLLAGIVGPRVLLGLWGVVVDVAVAEVAVVRGR